MGGNALSHTSVRLTKRNYDRVAATAVAQLRERFPGKRVQVIQAYRAKADFGDCDILVEGGEDYDPLEAAKAIGAEEVVRNGPVTSVGVRAREDVPFVNGNVFQVDLVKTDPASFDFAVGYFSYNDLGNLIGRIAHAMGLAFRHDGLAYYFREGDYLFHEEFLTQDFSQALAFLGYDPKRYAQGFETLEDIFQFTASTPYFNPDIFLLENRNHRSRTRDRKRPTYTAFLEWCAKLAPQEHFEYPADKSEWLPHFFKRFPAFKETHGQVMARLAETRAVQAKFNGEWVSQLTGLQGKGLGALMKRFKESFESPEAMRAYILAKEPASIEMRVRGMLSRMNEDGLFPMWEMLEAGFPVVNIRVQVERHLTGLLALPAETEGVDAAVNATRAMLEHLPVDQAE